MASRIILGGRPLGTGKYGGSPKCICGDPVAVLGRCLECHDALVRRRQGLPPKDEAQQKRLAGYLRELEARSSTCKDCGKTLEEEHDPRCRYANM